MYEVSRQCVTEDLKRIEEHLGTLDLKGLRNLYQRAVGNPLKAVCHEAEQPEIREEILAACKERTHGRVELLRAMGELAYDPELLIQMLELYGKSVHEIILNWEIWPPLKAGSKLLRSKPLCIAEVWKLVHHDEWGTHTPHPYEYEQFLRDHKFFSVLERARGEGIVIELSEAGLAYRQRFDADRRVRKRGRRVAGWLAKNLAKGWRSVGKKVLIGVMIGIPTFVLGRLLYDYLK